MSEIKNRLFLILLAATFFIPGTVLAKEDSLTQINNPGNITCNSNDCSYNFEYEVNDPDFEIMFLSGKVIVNDSQLKELNYKDFTLNENENTICYKYEVDDDTNYVNFTLNYRDESYYQSKSISHINLSKINFHQIVSNSVNVHGKEKYYLPFRISGTSLDIFRSLNFSTYLDGIEIPNDKTGLMLVAELDCSNDSILGEHSLRISLKDYDLDFVYKINIVDEYKLKSLRFTSRKAYMRLGDVNNVLLIKDPIDYECLPVYSSNDEAIASVDEEGNITATGVGRTYINVECSNKTAKLLVDVNNNPTGVEIGTKGKNFVEVGKTKELDIKIYPENAEVDIEKLFIYSSDFMIANVEGNIIEGRKEGTVDINYRFNGEDFKATYLVIPQVEEIVPHKTDMELTVGMVDFLKYNTTPFDISLMDGVKIYSEDEDVAYFKNNAVFATGVGKTNIVFEYGDIVRKTRITVNPREGEVEEIPPEFRVRTRTLNVKVGDVVDMNDYTDNPDGYVLFFRGNDPSFELENTGKLTALKAGSSIISIETSNTTQYIEVIVSDQ